MKRWWGAVFLALFATAAPAAADDQASGADMVSRVKTAALLDGSWDVTNQYNSLIVDRGVYSAPWVSGLAAHFTQRALYGTSWTIVVGLEGVAAIAAKGGRFDWLDGARYRTDWMVPLDLPACPHIGANAGCGLGTGGFSFLSVRPHGTRWWFEVGGGSFDQRVMDDALRDVGETTWVLTPLTALYELASPGDAPIAVRWDVGPGVFFGMLNANMHPSAKGEDVFRNRPWTELYPLYGGVGPGGRTELEVTLARHLKLEGDLTVAPFFLGGASSHVSSAVAPVDHVNSGFPIWRKLDFGIGYRDLRIMQFEPAVEVFAAELTTRPLDRAGYRGVMVRFDIPLRLPAD